MGSDDLIFGLLIGLLFGFLNNLEERQPKYYSCPEYCSVVHTHIGVKNEKKEPNKQRPLSGDKWLAYDDEPADAPDYNGIGSGE